MNHSISAHLIVAVVVLALLGLTPVDDLIAAGLTPGKPSPPAQAVPMQRMGTARMHDDSAHRQAAYADPDELSW